MGPNQAKPMPARGIDKIFICLLETPGPVRPVWSQAETRETCPAVQDTVDTDRHLLQVSPAVSHQAAQWILAS